MVNCPSGSLINQTGSPLDGTQVLSSGEDSYLTTRRSRVLNDLYRTYLGNDTGYDVSAIISQEPKLYVFCTGLCRDRRSSARALTSLTLSPAPTKKNSPRS